MSKLVVVDAGLEFSSAALLFVLGMLLAGFYFAGLWWTVRAIAHVRHPWLLYLGSTAIRLFVLMGVLFFLMSGDWRRGLICLAGFVLGRSVMVYRLGLTELPSAVPKTGGLFDE